MVLLQNHFQKKTSNLSSSSTLQEVKSKTETDYSGLNISGCSKVYSQGIEQFLSSIRYRVKYTLEHIFGLRVNRTRFSHNRFTYPIIVVAFEHPNRLGYFDPNTFELGFNKHLQFESPKVIDQIIQHELAHYMTLIEFGTDVPHHGSEFISICKKYHIESAKPASISLPPLEKKKSQAAKIAKLINLGTSKNTHEANLALEKANALTRKWGIEGMEDGDEFIARPILYSKRSSQKLRSIANMLRTFFVFPVISHGREYVYLEIFGLPTHVEIGEYIGCVLDRLINTLWESEKGSDLKLRGPIAKNSFIRGLEKGFIERLQPTESRETALIKLENKLTTAASKAYPHLSSTFSRQKHNKKAFSSGKSRGKSLQIAPSLTKGKGVRKLLSFLS